MHINAIFRWARSHRTYLSARSNVASSTSARYPFVIFPQLHLHWNPNQSKDRRSDIPDIGLGRFTDTGAISLQGGAEQQAAIEIMRDLPPTSSIVEHHSFRTVIANACIQAADQVKAAVKNGTVPRNTTIKWIIASRPYFIIHAIEPFTRDEFTTRGDKPNPRGDAVISPECKVYMPVPGMPYLIGTEAAAYDASESK